MSNEKWILKDVKAVDHYDLLLILDNGEQRIYNPELDIAAAKQGYEMGKGMFSHVKVEDGTVVWENGFQLDLESLYKYSVPVATEEQQLLEKKIAYDRAKEVYKDYLKNGSPLVPNTPDSKTMNEEYIMSHPEVMTIGRWFELHPGQDIYLERKHLNLCACGCQWLDKYEWDSDDDFCGNLVYFKFWSEEIGYFHINDVLDNFIKISDTHYVWIDKPQTVDDVELGFWKKSSSFDDFYEGECPRCKIKSVIQTAAWENHNVDFREV